jgi:methanogenic corrinoid protein MtbC1
VVDEERLAGLTDVAELYKARTAEERRLSLARTIEAEIIPRLMLLHHEVPFGKRVRARAIDFTRDVLPFCQMTVHRPLAAASQYVAQLQAEGVTLDAIYLELFTPAARHLGQMWEQDTCGFADVTIGLSRLQQLMQSLSVYFCEERVTSGNAPRALLIQCPGEQHTLGIFMVSEFFRREGWDVWGNSFHAGEQVSKLVQVEWFDVLGISLANADHLARLKQLVDAAREASINPSLKILLGGPAVLARPELVQQAGADAMASDAQQAVQVATALVDPPKWR